MGQAELKKELKVHFSRLWSIKKSEDHKLFTTVTNTGRSLALYAAGYRCEACGSEENLTLHHLVGRELKKFVSFERYARRRHDFRNIVVLCYNCHLKIEDKKTTNDRDRMGLLSLKPKTIEEVKRRFGVKQDV